MSNFRKRPTYTDGNKVTKSLLLEGEATNTPIVQTTGTSMTDVMSQEAVTRNLELKANKTNTISVNGLVKKLGDNPVFEVIDEDYVLDAISQIMNVNVPTYIITFDANGGTGDPNAITDWRLLTTRTLPDVGDMMRPGYKFTGWGSSTNSGVIWASGAGVRLSKSVSSSTNINYQTTELYAQWTPI